MSKEFKEAYEKARTTVTKAIEQVAHGIIDGSDDKENEQAANAARQLSEALMNVRDAIDDEEDE